MVRTDRILEKLAASILNKQSKQAKSKNAHPNKRTGVRDHKGRTPWDLINKPWHRAIPTGKIATLKIFILIQIQYVFSSSEIY